MELDPPRMKPCVFMGSSKKDLGDLPPDVRKSFGYALYHAQAGDEPLDAKALKGFGGRSVLEIVKDYDRDTYRAVYTVRFAEALYVPHVFRKKSKRGVETPRHIVDLILSVYGMRKHTIAGISVMESTRGDT
jgi:phage-related protein